MAEYPQAITVYETSDGKRHDLERSARDWERAIGAAREATSMLRSGVDLATCYSHFYRVAYGFELAEQTASALTGLTQRSMFVVSYWQCRDTPGYQPIGILPDGRIDVWGDAGSWSGPYGSPMGTTELLRVLDETRRVCKGEIPERAL